MSDIKGSEQIDATSNTFSFDSPQTDYQETKRVHLSDDGIFMTAEEYLEDIRQKAVARYKPVRDKEKEIRTTYNSDADKARMEVERHYGTVQVNVEISDFDRKFGRKTVGQERYGGLPKFSKPSPNSPKIENPADPDTIESWAKDVPDGWFRIGNDLVQPLNPHINKHIRKAIRSVDQKKRDKYEKQKEIRERREAKESAILAEHGVEGLENYKADKVAKSALAEERRLEEEALKPIEFVLNPDNFNWIIKRVKANAAFRSIPENKKLNLDYTSYISHLWEVLQGEISAGRGFDSKYFQKRDRNWKAKPVDVKDYVARYIGYIACQLHIHQEGVYYGIRSGTSYSKLNNVIRVLESYMFNMNTDFEQLSDTEVDLVEIEVLNEPAEPNSVTYIVGTNNHQIGQVGFKGLDFQSSCDDIELEGIEHTKVFIVLTDDQRSALKAGNSINLVYDFNCYREVKVRRARLIELRDLDSRLRKINVRVRKASQELTEKNERLYELTPHEREGKDFLQRNPYILQWVKQTKQKYEAPTEESDAEYTEWGEVIASNPTLEEQAAHDRKMQEQEAERLKVESAPGPAGYQFIPKNAKILGTDRLKAHKEIRELRREVAKLTDELEELNQESNLIGVYLDSTELEMLEKWFVDVELGISGGRRLISGLISEEFELPAGAISDIEEKLCKQLGIPNKKLSLDILKSERSRIQSDDTLVSLDKEYGNERSSNPTSLKDYIPDTCSKLDDWEVETDFRHYMTNLIIKTKRAGRECHRGLLQFIVSSKYFKFDHFYGQDYPEEALEGRTLRGTRQHYTQTFMSEKGNEKLAQEARRALLYAFKTDEHVNFIFRKVFDYISALGYKRASEIIQELDFKLLDSPRHSKFQSVFGRELEGRQLVADIDYDSETSGYAERELDKGDKLIIELPKKSKNFDEYMNSDGELDPDDVLTEGELSRMVAKAKLDAYMNSDGELDPDDILTETDLRRMWGVFKGNEKKSFEIPTDDELNLPDEEDLVEPLGKFESKVWFRALAVNMKVIPKIANPISGNLIPLMGSVNTSYYGGASTRTACMRSP